ncbi:MAG: squalene/phytoene synthase family protein [Pseudomonadota bacterium]
MVEDAIADGDRAAHAIVMAARAHERDRYLTALLAPKSARQHLVNLAAFQGEVARIPLFVTEPMIGEIRLQWWRDTLSNAAAGLLSGNPIADALVNTMNSTGLSPGLVAGMIDAQTLALYSDPPSDELALCQNLTKLEGGALELAAHVLKGAALAPEEAAFCSEAGVAYGLARTAVEFAAVTAQGRTLLPADWLVDAGLTLGDLSDDAKCSEVAALVGRLAADADDRARRLRQTPDATPPVRAACRPLAMVSAYANAVRRHGVDAVRTSVDVLPLTRVWRIWWG